MKIRVLMITHNRPDYTKLSLSRLTETLPSHAKAVVWDNASSEENLRVLRGFEEHPAIEKIIYNKTNDRLRGPTNWFWRNHADADLLGKIDDDCLMPARWVEKLEKAHRDIPDAGIIGCWRFLPEDFNVSKATRKIHSFGPHMILRNCWIEGSGYLMKRKLVEEIGTLRPKETFTTWCLRAAARGYVIGWYYPFLYQEHMDDPRAEHSGIKTDEDLRRLLPLSARQYGVRTREEWVKRLKGTAQRLQEYSLDPYDFIGLRSKLKRKLYRMLGLAYFPRE
ncbi:MAG: glycosyltransferase [Thermodesulfobacteriota bacterium]|nr:MAG: glycosyltransferase [Thermodesulfobacteriota bacterium]